MDWNAISAIAEVLGAVGVIITLIYLATQIKNQNVESRLSAMHDISTGFRESTGKLLDANLTEIFLEDFDSLSKSDKLRLIIGITSIFRAWEEAYILFEEGNLDTRIWDPMTSYYTHILGAPSVKSVWSLRKKHFDKKFRGFVDTINSEEFDLNFELD